ncbi:MAG TPA: PD-(D/E)XK nuclease family protein [Chloroflexota bacterium]
MGPSRTARPEPDVKLTGTIIDGNEPPRVAVPHISFSQASMYLRCSMQYYFRYVLGLKERPKLALGIGKGGHSALEFNSRHKIKTGADLATSDLLDAASTFIDMETADLSKSDLNGEDKGEAKDRAIAAIQVYRVRDAEAVHPAGVEVEFNLDLNVPNEEPIRIINGKIDLITTDAGVEDYKFVGQARSQTEVDFSPQLTLYGKVFTTLTGKVPSKTGYRMFLPGSTRTPPDTRVIYRDPALMTPQAQQSRFERLAFQFRQVERGIRTGLFMPTDDPKVCSWCGFRERCQSSLVTDFEAARLRGEN